MSGKKLTVQIAVIVQLTALLNIFLVKSPAQNSSKAPETVYSNTTSLAINSAPSSTPPFIATVYPSNIDVSGMTGNITRVAVTLNGLTHTRLNEVDLLLVSPTGAKYVFLADAGGFVTLDDKLFTFSDDAPGTLPVNSPDLPSGNYRPTSGDAVTDIFPAPAPAGPYSLPPVSTFGSIFNGANPNGTWSLFAVDDLANEAGSINAGWSITITTDAAPATFVNSNHIALNDQITPATPYGTPINIAGASGVISNLKVTLTGFSHTRPLEVDILLVSPNGKGVVILSDAGGQTAATNADLTFDDTGGVLNTIVTGTYRPTDNSASFSDIFPSPAPLRPHHALTGSNSLSNFYGFSPNGEWRLFVVDANANNSGSISGGWSLDITTTPIVPPTPPACGAPSFSTTSFATGVSPTNLALADFNNDAKHDLAVTNQVSNDVSILLGTGTGSFLPQTSVPAGSSPYSVAAAKFNADNNFDLAVVNSGSNNVSILLGNGDGTFGPPTNFFVGPSPISVAVGDLNNDGNQDLAVANFGGFFSGSVSILLGNGAGSFTTGTPVRTRTQPSFVAIANLNSTDSHRDLVVTSFGSNSATTFFGVGNGTFFLSQNIAVGAGPVWVDIADMGTPDGFPDLVIANYNSDSIHTCSGSSSGIFSCSSSPAGGANPISVAAADYVGNGMRSSAVTLSGSNTVRVGASNVSVGLNPNAVESADFNGDGKVDLVSVNAGSNDISVLINNCAVATGNIFDWDGDRRTDFSVMRPSTRAWFNASLSGFSSVKIFSRPGDTLVPADYDGDGRTDYGLFRPESGLWMVQSGLLFVTRPIYFLQFGITEDIPVPADYDGDGKADLAVFRPSTGTWYVRRTFDNSVQATAFGLSGDKPVQGDFDGDGKSDLAIFRPSTGVWYVLRSSDSQTFIVQFGASEDKTVAGDYDGDGKADIAVWRPSTAVWWVLRSSDGGSSAVGWGAAGDIPVLGDYENDGKFDYAVWRPSDRIWYVLKSSDLGAIYFQWGLSTDYPIPNAYVR